jgi:hypothetical protein
MKSKYQTKKGTRSRPYYSQKAKRATTRRTHKPHVYIQRHTTTRILASLVKVCTYNNDTQTWENPNGRFFLPTNQLITDIKSTKTHTKKKMKI